MPNSFLDSLGLEYLWNKIKTLLASEKGIANGVASLDTTAKVPISQLPEIGGKRTARFVIGTSVAGWTVADVDYLCDGISDDIEINAAIQALPSTGGEIIILDGTYNITADIVVNKNNVTLSGNGQSTILKRMYDGSSESGIIHVISNGNTIQSLTIDGNKSNYSSTNNDGIYLETVANNTVTGNRCNDNASCGLYLSESDNNTISGNTCNSNNYGVYLGTATNNVITDNICNNNSKRNIYLTKSTINNITSNTCNNAGEGIYLKSSSNNTITGNICNNNTSFGIYLVSSTNDSTITGNTCNNNKSGIYLSASHNNTATGNTCNNNSYEGIFMFQIKNNTATGNTCNNNNTGISLDSLISSTIAGNMCNNNNSGIYLTYSNNSIVAGNTCIRGNGTTSDYTSDQYTIRTASRSENNLIIGNNILGKNYVDGGSGNTWVNNKYQ